MWGGPRYDVGYKRVATLGDSITEGYYATDGLGYQKYLLPWLASVGARLVGTRHPDRVPFCPTDGKSGDNLAQMLARWPNIAAVSRPQVVVLLGGTNNLWGTGPQIAASRADHASLRTAIYSYGCPLVVMSITPNGSSQGADDQMVAANVLLAADVAADAAVGKRVSWVDIHTPIIAVGGWLGTLIEAIAPQLHPLDAGHSLIAATLWPYLAAAIAGV